MKCDRECSKCGLPTNKQGMQQHLKKNRFCRAQNATAIMRPVANTTSSSSASGSRKRSTQTRSADERPAQVRPRRESPRREPAQWPVWTTPRQGMPPWQTPPGRIVGGNELGEWLAENSTYNPPRGVIWHDANGNLIRRPPRGN